MSGLAGYCGKLQQDDVLTSMLRRMGSGGACSTDIAAPVYMGTTAGQIYRSADEGVALMLEGSIENLPHLRATLSAKGVRFESGSPEETIFYLYKDYGVGFLQHLSGGFAIVLHDKQKNFLMAGRDHAGVRPLYYTTTQSGEIVFASEVRALLVHPGVHTAPDMLGIDAFLSLGYSPGPETMFKNIRKLPAGSRLIWNSGLHVSIEPYWRWEKTHRPDAGASYDPEIVTDFEKKLDQRLSDLHAAQAGKSTVLLSEGLPAMSLLASANRQQLPVEALSVEFDTSADEWQEETGIILKRMGITQNTAVFHAADMQMMPEMVWEASTPSGDPARLIRYFSGKQVARDRASVLSASGAAALLCGESAQEHLLRARRKPELYFSILYPLMKGIPSVLLPAKHVDARQRTIEFMCELLRGDLIRQYDILTSVFSRVDKKHLYLAPMHPYASVFSDRQKDVEGWGSDAATLAAFEERHHLQDHLLSAAAVTATATGSRWDMVFANRDMIEILLALPDRLRFQDGKGMMLLRPGVEKATASFSPRAPKGLDAHIGRFLDMKPMREMVETCLSEKSLMKRGYFSYPRVRHIAARARAGDPIAARQIFALLSLELWFRIFIDNEKGWISG